MSWPLASHFSAMLQNPQIAFRDPSLKGCVVEKDEMNQPRPWAGAFAVVYKALDAESREPFAVRVFTTESPERRERYDLVSAYLKDRKLRSLVNFEYRDRSIRSAGDGKWYPMILMEWVQGETLFKWVQARCAQGDRSALARCAERWVEVVKELALTHVVHGDLQHANVMVTPAGELKLVDYDCMCVPSLIGRRNLEVGVEPYQHPGRNERTLLSLDLDNFSALVIYVALRALACDSQLWQKYIERPGYDKLLFRLEDFRSPGTSPLYHDLMHLGEQEVVELTEQLFSLAQARIDQVPPLSQMANSYRKVEQLLQQQQWGAAVSLLNRRGHFRDAPDHLKPLIHQAYEFVCRQQAWEIFRRIPDQATEARDRELVHAWNEALFSGFEPAERQRLRVAEARRRVMLVERLGHHVQQSSAAITLASERGIVEAASHLPQGYQYSLLARVEQAKRRVSALGRLEQAIQKPVSEATIVATWRAVREAQCEPLVDPAWQQRTALAERRAPLLKALAAMNEQLPPDQRDEQILKIWQEELLKDCREADRWRTAYQAACQRQDILRRLQEALMNKDQATAEQLRQDPCLAGYPIPAELSGDPSKPSILKKWKGWFSRPASEEQPQT